MDRADRLLYYAANLQQTMTDLVAGEAGHLRIASIEPVASIYLAVILVINQRASDSDGGTLSISQYF